MRCDRRDFRSTSGRRSRVGASSWHDAKVLLKVKILEIRSIDGRIRVARKDRHPDEGNPPIEPYDPCGPGPDDVVIEEARYA